MSSYDEFSHNLKKKHSIIVKRQKREHPDREIPNGYNFFENKDCVFYPCHDTHIPLNCMFCRCPAYEDKLCPGIKLKLAHYLENGVKDCSNCVYPHDVNNYEEMMYWGTNE